MSNAYILSLDNSAERAVNAKQILDRLLFKVFQCEVIPHEEKSFSNRLSMLNIMKLITSKRNKWSYVFEDDIQFWEYISPKKLKHFEKASKNFFYLGACSETPPTKTKEKILDISAYRFQTNKVGCSHAFAITKEGAKLVLEKAKDFDESVNFDEILSTLFAPEKPLVVMNEESGNVSYQNKDHYGLVFQDKFAFSSNPSKDIPNVSIHIN